MQLPLMIPIDGLPARPDSTIGNLVHLVAEAMAMEDADSVVAVIERYADATLTVADQEWARALHDAFGQQQVPLRGILLSHRRGVRWVAQDDYRFGAAD